LKEANPIKTAEYAVSKGISEEPAFNWWVPYTLKKRDFIISAIRARFIWRDYKFGIKVPANIKEARALDLENGDGFWKRSVEKEMKTSVLLSECWRMAAGSQLATSASHAC